MEDHLNSDYIIDLSRGSSNDSPHFRNQYKAALSTLSREVLPDTYVDYRQELFNRLDKLESKDKLYKIRLAANAFLSGLPLGRNTYELSTKNDDHNYFGIGAVIKKIGNRFVIVDVLEESGSFRANLYPGMHISRVNELDVSQFDLPEVVSRIRGRKNSFVELTMQDGKKFQVERDDIKFLPIQYAMWPLKKGGALLYLMPRTTHIEVSGRIRNILKTDSQTRTVVIDLRKLFNGSTESCFVMADLFISDGTSIYLKSRTSTVSVFKSDQEKIFSKDIYVIYNENSSPLARFFAFLLRNEKNVTIIGIPDKLDLYLNMQKDIEGGRIDFVSGLIYDQKQQAIQDYYLEPDISMHSLIPRNPPLSEPDPTDPVQLYLGEKFKLDPN